MVLLNSQASASVPRISALVNGCGLWPTASAAIAVRSTAMTIPGDREQDMPVRIVVLGKLADFGRLAGPFHAT
jgi:hypothetical protein